MDNTLNFIVIGGITLESGTHIHGYHVILNGLVVKERILTTTTPIDTDRCNDLTLAMRASRKLTDDIPDFYEVGEKSVSPTIQAYCQDLIRSLSNGTEEPYEVRPTIRR